jgi:hypothetical protein
MMISGALPEREKRVYSWATTVQGGLCCEHEEAKG